MEFQESLKYRYKGILGLFVSILFVLLFYSVFSGSLVMGDSTRNYIKLKQFIGNKALLYSLPLLLLVKPNPEFWRSFIKYSYLLLFVFLSLLLLDLVPYLTREKSPEGLIRASAGVSGFLLLISPYFKAVKRNLVLAIYLVSLLLMMYHARRNMVLYFGSFLIFYYYLSFFSNNVLFKVSRLRILSNTLFLGVIAGLVFVILNPDFSLFFERAETGMDSREGVIEDFFQDIIPFSNDFLFGRGMYGRVTSLQLGVDEYENLGGGYREGIENGYLQLILNFGFIYLFLFVFLSLRAFFLGVTNSNNLLAKACGALVLINLVDMVGFGIPELTFRYFLLWLSLTFCYSRRFRKLNDVEIKNLIFN